MIYKFRIFSDEVDRFERSIIIDSEALFIDLHHAVLESVGYDKDEMSSFFVCDDEWEKEVEITLIEMDNNPEIDTWVMDRTHLSELVEEEGQKMVFMFDYLTERGFFMELEEVVPGKHLDKAECVHKLGKAPKQHVDFEEFEKKTEAAAKKMAEKLDMDSDFYGDSEFDMEELDSEGFNEGFGEDFSSSGGYDDF